MSTQRTGNQRPLLGTGMDWDFFSRAWENRSNEIMPSKLLSNLEIFSQAISVNPARSQNPTFQALFLGSYWRTGYVLCNNNVNGEHKIMKSRRISNTGNSRGSWNPAQHTQSQGQQKMESRWDAAKRRDTK